MAARCCQCNGVNGKCLHCACARSGVRCVSCLPGLSGKCRKTSGITVSSGQAPATLASSSATCPDLSSPLSPSPGTSVGIASSSSVDFSSLLSISRVRVFMLQHVPKGARDIWSGLVTGELNSILASPSNIDYWNRFWCWPSVSWSTLPTGLIPCGAPLWGSSRRGWSAGLRVTGSGRTSLLRRPNLFANIRRSIPQLILCILVMPLAKASAEVWDELLLRPLILFLVC